jgi:hypothetical protein
LIEKDQISLTLCSRQKPPSGFRPVCRFFLAALADCLRVLIETLLHSFEQVFVLPSRDAPLGSQ